MKDGKRTSFWLDAVQYNKGWNELFIANQQPFISQYEGKPRFSQLFMDTIFAITKDDIQTYIVLQSKNFVTKDYLDSQKETKKASKIFSNLNNTTKIYNICNYLESDRYVYFNYYNIPLISSKLFIPSFFMNSSIPSIISRPILGFMKLAVPT